MPSPAWKQHVRAPPTLPGPGLYRLLEPLDFRHDKHGRVHVPAGAIVGVRAVGRVTALVSSAEVSDVRVGLGWLQMAAERLG